MTPQTPQNNARELLDTYQYLRKEIERYRLYLANHDVEYAKLFPAGLLPGYGNPEHKAADRQETEWILHMMEDAIARFERKIGNTLTH